MEKNGLELDDSYGANPIQSERKENVKRNYSPAPNSARSAVSAMTPRNDNNPQLYSRTYNRKAHSIYSNLVPVRKQNKNPSLNNKKLANINFSNVK